MKSLLLSSVLGTVLILFSEYGKLVFGVLIGQRLEMVEIVTADGRVIVGTLKGFDQTINLILDESHERVYSTGQGVEQVILGLYIVRGDNVAVIGEVDDDQDNNLDFEAIRAEPLNAIAH